MPKDPSIRKVLIIGSGPIVIGQAAEFDYAGTQACLACREEGIEVILVNSNPATIQTDPDMADRVYIEPLTVPSLTEIICKERPDGLIATMGGQTALNLAVELERAGVLNTYGVRVLGTSIATIGKAEDRQLFADLMEERGQPVLAHTSVSNLWEAVDFARQQGFPLVARAAFCLGGTGSGHADDMEQFETLVQEGLAASPANSVLIERSVAGWAEVEYEVLRDSRDNAIIVCNMENMDPMGIHTGDSIVVAPSQTLSDEDYQRLRTASLEIVRALDVRGSCNCQFALNQQTGEFAIIEVNPRLSRSSALASKATGYPIARVAAKIALGYTLADLRNDITGASACAEPALDYLVVKLPRWPFDKFRNVDHRLGMTMKSTGEVMAIGRSFEQAFLKALRSLDVGSSYLTVSESWTQDRIASCLGHATHERPAAIYNAIAQGWRLDEISNLTHIHPWFIERIARIYEMAQRYQREAAGREVSGIRERGLEELEGAADLWRTLAEAKRMGFSDDHLAALAPQFPSADDTSSTLPGTSAIRNTQYAMSSSQQVREERLEHGIHPVYKMVDTCAGEFVASTPYFYSTYEGLDRFTENEAGPLQGPKAIVLGSGPIRIGQGIEFDYSSVHAVEALQEMGVKAIVINNNPETVSTDYHLSDRLYFEPLTLEEVLNVVEHEKDGLLGVIAQFGGQTALNLVKPLVQAGVTILGTSPDSIAGTEDRNQMAFVCEQLGIPTPAWTIVQSHDDIETTAQHIDFPVLVRPSYVLGGRGMKVINRHEELGAYLHQLGPHLRKHPVLVDQFLEDATEIDVDAVSDGRDAFVIVMEQLEKAGIHSGDSTCVYPSQTLSSRVLESVEAYTLSLARYLKVVGLINVQYAVKDEKVYLLEVNARASRTVPFASKATGVPIARIATRMIMGEPLSESNISAYIQTKQVSVKTVVLPFGKFPSLSPVLGPEMQSTGEAMGVGADFHSALARARIGAGARETIGAQAVSLVSAASGSAYTDYPGSEVSTA